MLTAASLYISLFFTSFFASTILPLGSEGYLAYLASSGHNLAIIISIATVGNFFGSLTNYYVGILGEKTILSRYIKIDNMKMIKAKQVFDKYGNPVLFFSWVPGVGDALTLFAGIIGSDLKKFTLYVFTGKLARYIVVALIFS